MARGPTPYVQKVVWKYIGKGYRKARKQLGDIEDELEDVEEQSDDTSQAAGGVSRRFRQVGRAAKRWLATAAVGALSAVTAALGAAAREAAEFNSKLKEVGSLMEGSVGGDLDRFAQGIDRIRRDLPVATDLTKALYDTISAGVDPDNAIAFLRTAAEASVAGVTDAKTAVDALTSALNAYGLEASEAEDVSDTFFTAVKAGKTTFGELAGTMGKVLPIASTLGVDLQEVNAALATLTKSGLSTKEAGTALRSLFNQLIQNSKEFEAAGIDVQQVLDDRGLLGVLREVQQQTGGNAQEIRKLFRDVEGLNAVLSLAGEQSAEYAEILQSMETNSGATAEAVRKMDKGATALWKTFKNRLSVAARNLGETILPTLNEAMRLTNQLFGDAQASALERFLSSIQQVEGVDPQVEAQLRATIDMRQAKEQLQEAEDDLSTEIDVGVDLTKHGGEGGLISEPVSEMSKEELKSRLQAVNEALAERAQRIAQLEKQGKEVSELAERRRFLLEQAQEGLLKGLEIRSRVEAATQAQAAAQTKLNKALKDQPASGDDSGGTGSGFDFPQTQDVEQVPQAQAAGLQKVAKGWRNVGKIVSDVTPKQLDALGQINGMVASYRDRIQELRFQLAKGDLTPEEFDEKAQQAAESYIESLREVVRMLEEMGLIGEEEMQAVIAGIDEMQRQTEEAEGSAQSFVDALDEVATVSGGLADAAESMGLISESTRRAVDDTEDLLGQLQRVLKVGEDGQLGLDLDFDSFTSALGSVSSLVGIAGTLSQIIGRIGSDQDARRQREAMEELRSQLRENTRSLKENTQALREQKIVGAEVSEKQLMQANRLVDELTSSVSTPDGRNRDPQSSFTEEAARTRLEQLEQTGIEAFQNLVDTFNTVREQESVSVGEALLFTIQGDDAAETDGEGRGGTSDFPEREGIDETLEILNEKFGRFGASLDAIIEEMDVRKDILGQGAETIRQALTSVPEGSGSGSSRLADIGFDEELTTALRERIADLDLDDQEAVKGLVENLGSALVTGGDLGFLGVDKPITEVLGDATPQDFKGLIEFLQRSFLKEGDGGQSGPDTRVTSQVQQTITEFQANELLAYQQEQVMQLRKIGSYLQAQMQSAGGSMDASSIASITKSTSTVKTLNIENIDAGGMTAEEIAQKMEEAFQQMN